MGIKITEKPVINITHIAKKYHHQYAAILDRVEKAKQERLKEVSTK